MILQAFDGRVETAPLGPGQKVSRELVHKHFPENVLLSEVAAASGGGFLCRGRVPRDHVFFNEPGREPGSDLLYFTELGRQAGIAVSHAFFDVPRGHAFILARGSIYLLDKDRDGDPLAGSESITVQVKVTDQEVRRAGYLARLVADYAFFQGDMQVAHGLGEWNLQPEALYRRVRRLAPRPRVVEGERYAGPSLDPRDLGRQRAENVVISPPMPTADGRGITAQLLIDQGNRFFFDHPQDHVPGVLLAEGAAQLAALAAPDMALSGWDLRFLSFAELDVPVRLEARITAVKRDGRGRLRGEVFVRFLQGETEVGEVAVQAAFPREVAAQPAPQAEFRAAA